MFSKIYFILIFTILSFIIYFYSFLISPLSNTKENYKITIQKGTSFLGVTDLLIEHHLIKQRFYFKLLAYLRNVTRKIKAGEYEFSGNLNAHNILAKLVKGDVIKYKITIPEGYNIFEIAKLLEAKGLTDRVSFIDATKDPSLLSFYNIRGESVEGYLFPNTYMFTKGMSNKDMIKAMILQFNKIYKKEFDIRANELGLSKDEVITLASIIEKETSIDDEMNIISQVFHTRLKLDMRLESDPTVIYAINNFDGNLTTDDIKRATPYNTYVIKGLPPGPISNPSIKSINAAINPAPTSYLFFVSKNDGSHVFSSTLKEHNFYVNEFQKR